MDHLYTAAVQFRREGRILDVREHGLGNINDTFLVSIDASRETRFILQRINTRVFPRPELIVLNIRTFAEHVSRRLQAGQPDSGRRWEVPRLLAARDGSDYYVDSDGSFWRALSYIDSSRTYETVQDTGHAREAGYALGLFHDLVSDLESEKLYDTLEGFHITPQYLEHYDRVLAVSSVTTRSAEAVYCENFIAERRAWASVLEDAKAQGKLSSQPIHGDPKINNFMIDDASGQAVGMVDLDTVKPGLVHYDIGDCLRSCCNPLGEETSDIGHVRFETGLCRAILEGYLAAASGFLGRNDYAYLYDSIRLLTYELGVRFFTDYLEGNVYFKTRDDVHNLMRALVQFKLTESIECQEKEIRTIITDLT